MTPASKGLTREEALVNVALAIHTATRCPEWPESICAPCQRAADLLLSIDRSARKSEWEARGGPELVRVTQQCDAICETVDVLDAALARTESPATAPKALCPTHGTERDEEGVCIPCHFGFAPGVTR